MSFRPAWFTDIQRSGPPSTVNGIEWRIKMSTDPPAEWRTFFQDDGGAGSSAAALLWGVNVQLVELHFKSAAEEMVGALEHIDARIHRANDAYRHWLDETHRRADERRHGERTEADRVRDLNDRFKDL